MLIATRPCRELGALNSRGLTYNSSRNCQVQARVVLTNQSRCRFILGSDADVLVLELRQRPDFRAHWALGFWMTVILGGLRLAAFLLRFSVTSIRSLTAIAFLNGWIRAGM